jgi:hypothetical protein
MLGPPSSFETLASLAPQDEGGPAARTYSTTLMRVGTVRRKNRGAAH